MFWCLAGSDVDKYILLYYTKVHVTFRGYTEMCFCVLTKKNRNNHTITGFLCHDLDGDESSEVRHLQKATGQLETKNGVKILMEVIIIPEIAAPITNRSRINVKVIRYLKGLKLAHPISSDKEFHILLLGNCWSNQRKSTHYNRSKDWLSNIWTHPFINKTIVSNVSYLSWSQSGGNWLGEIYDDRIPRN